jgi:hypothetical protein
MQIMLLLTLTLIFPVLFYTYIDRHIIANDNGNSSSLQEKFDVYGLD